MSLFFRMRHRFCFSVVQKDEVTLCLLFQLEIRLCLWICCTEVLIESRNSTDGAIGK